MNVKQLDSILEEGVESGIFPCAAAAIGRKNQIFYQRSVGNRQLVPEKEQVTSDTLFDIASLTKILSSTMLALIAMEQGKLSLYDSLSRFYPNAGDKGEITILDLMTHQSGLPSHAPLWKMGIQPHQLEDTILSLPFSYPTGSQVSYSCMGYLLLGKILEKLFSSPLNDLAKSLVFSPLGMNHTCYLPSSDNTAATEYMEDKKSCYQGTVHDENARFLGGIAGNAGVFSTISDMVRFASMLSKDGEGLLSPRTLSSAVRNYTPFDPNEARGLGFQLFTGRNCMACGDFFSPLSFGHTGFTGTSLFVDRETGLFVVLLTNRVHPSRENDGLLRFRRVFHNTVWGAVSKEEIL